MSNSDWRPPEYPVFLDVSYSALSACDDINYSIEGSIGMTLQDASILANTVLAAGNGNHLEIGSLFGGTAILAALVKKYNEFSGKVYCIDDGNMAGEPNIIRDNAIKMGVADKIEIHKGSSYPYPLDPGIKFITALVDAGHGLEEVQRDLESAMKVTTKYIVVHDYDPSHPGVVQAVNQIRGTWIPVLIYGHTAVLEFTG